MLGLWELYYKKSWASKNWCFWTVLLEKTLESPLNCKEIQPVHPKGDQSWVFIVRTDVEAETPVLWPPHVKSWLIRKDPDAGREWGQEEKGTTEDEMAGWHHRLNGHESEWTPGAGDGQEGLACCGLWGRKESDTTERLNWTDAGSWLLCMGFSSCGLGLLVGFSCCGAWALELVDLVAVWHAEFSQTRGGTHVPCIDRQIPFQCTTRKVRWLLQNIHLFIWLFRA